MNKQKKLIFKPLKFYSPLDEELFFNWINKIDCIQSYKGIAKELHLIVSSRPITFEEYRNLNGLFTRYKLKNPNQLKRFFCTKENQSWFKD